MTVLIDTSFLLALANVRDENHAQVFAAIQILTEPRVVPVPVLPELFYMVVQRVDYAQAVKFFRELQGGDYQLQPLTTQDMHRMYEIMVKYEDAEFDFVDVAIMALAEQLNITRICTLDQQDFRYYRPAHCDYLELLP